MQSTVLRVSDRTASNLPVVDQGVMKHVHFLSDRLVGLVVKASASRAEGPWFESRLRRDFFGVESYQ